MKDDIRYLSRLAVNPESLNLLPNLKKADRSTPEWQALIREAEAKANDTADRSLLGGPTAYQRLLALDAAQARVLDSKDKLLVDRTSAVSQALQAARAGASQWDRALQQHYTQAILYKLNLERFQALLAGLREAGKSLIPRHNLFRAQKGLEPIDIAA